VVLAAIFTGPESAAFFYLERFRDWGTGCHSQKFRRVPASISKVWAPLAEELARKTSRLNAAAWWQIIAAGGSFIT
jgi:hypothetical protein